MYCNATAVLKTDSIYKQIKNYHPQVYVKKCKYTDAESQQCNMLSDDEGDWFFEVWKRTHKNNFCKVVEGYKTNNKWTRSRC